MLFWVLAGGAIGGILRGFIGLWKYGKPPKPKNLLWAVIIPAIIGLEAAYTLFDRFPVLGEPLLWKNIVVGALAGYVAVDIVNSFYKILIKRGVVI